MAKRDLEFSAVMTLNSKAKAFIKKGTIGMDVTMRRVVGRAEKLAKQNVAKGKGPSPHTGDADRWGHNWPHEDTGWLAEHTYGVVWPQGFHMEGSVYTDQDYGVYLEVGWWQNGRFYRYPWMKPAFLEAMKLLPKMAAETFRTMMTDLDSQTIVSGVTLDKWSESAQRWSDELRQEHGKTESPAIRPSGGRRPRVNVRVGQKVRGRPKKEQFLGEELPGHTRRRAQSPEDRDKEISRRRETAKAFDTRKVRTRKGERAGRSEISAEEARTKYERTRAEREQRANTASEARAAARKAREDARQAKAEATARKLNEANKALSEKMRIKPKRTPSIKRKKKNP